MKYIIVQAGGKGTRLGYLTENKPKALVPIGNLPVLFHLFQKYSDKRFIIIADYKKDVLRKYLSVFANVKYQVVEAEGTGTCSGVRQAVEYIPDGEPFMLIWSDLVLPVDLRLPDEYEAENSKVEKDYIGISKTFPCRWSYQSGQFVEERSCEHGIAGLFLFSEKKKIEAMPLNGELVRWLQQCEIIFQEINLAGTREIGLLEEYEKLGQDKCRPFNRITIEDGVLIKEPVDEQGEKLAIQECAWYEKAKELNIQILPHIYSMNPLRMEFIRGKNIYECQMSYGEKKQVLRKLTEALQQLHESKKIPADSFSIKEAYYNKTFDRIQRIRDLVPYANEEFITINGHRCRNVFFNKRALELKIGQLSRAPFCFIHGDCTFSNLMLREDGSPVLIDPRGYFGHTKLYGDPRYDWAKLYYSIVGNYDQFNLKNFRLNFEDKEVYLEITSNHWEDMEKDFFEMTGTNPEEIKLLHALIWLSLTTYAWQDYDSICGAFYNGLNYLEEVL